MRSGRGKGWLLIMGVIGSLCSSAWALDLDSQLAKEIKKQEQVSSEILGTLGRSRSKAVAPSQVERDTSGLNVELLKASVARERSS